MDIGRPELSFAGLASSMGVPGRRVDDVPGMVSALREAFERARPAPDRGGGLMALRAIVTGGASGIGAAVADTLRERGRAR